MAAFRSKMDKKLIKPSLEKSKMAFCLYSKNKEIASP